MSPPILLSRLSLSLRSINPRRSFRSRLSLAVGSVAFALLILLSMLVGYSTTQQIEADTGHFLSELAYQMADKLDRGMFERYRDIQIAASLDTLRNPEASLEAKRALIEKLQSTYNDYAWIGFANPQGKVVVSTGKILEGANVSKRPWFINGQKTPYVGDVHEAILLSKLLPNPTNEPLRFVDITSVVTDFQNNSIGVLASHLSWIWAEKVQESILRSLEKRSQVELLVLSKTLAGDPVQIQQILKNLLSNAIKYIDKPQGKIKISCISDECYWKFSVADNGPGIESKYFEHIFQLFKTLPSKNQVDSTGVGLATVKKIVELYGGKIWVESIVGDGSTFFFTLTKKGY